MDPFTSLSRATSVITVVDFGTKLVKGAREIYKSGSISDSDQVKAVANDLKQLNQTLHSALDSALTPTLLLTEDELKLKEIGIETSKVADEVIQLLESVERRGGRNNPWKSFRQALAAISSKNKVSEITEKLDNFRNELVLRVVVSLKLSNKFRSVQDDERYRKLEENSKKIADTLLDDRSFFTTGIDRILQVQEDGSWLAQIRHEETIAAIATLQGSCMTNFSEELAEESLQDLGKIQQDILNFLWFRFIHDRKEEVSAPYAATFQWVYNLAAPSFVVWDSLSSWLAHGGGCYWINGKAGSGKSTFMKYLVNQQRTKELLTAWSGDQPLLCASFFFWGAGTPLQKSQQELLRSILYESLSQHPELVPIVFPNHSRQFARRMLATEPSLTELKVAFKLLIDQIVSPVKICFFIDGIDEYEGDHLQLVEFLRFC